MSLCYKDDDGSMGEESGSEASGDINATTYAAVDLRDETGKDRERVGGEARSEPMATLLQQTLARTRPPVPSQPSTDQPVQGEHLLFAFQKIFRVSELYR